MNYLAHIALAGPSPEHRVGGLLGDFVRGPLIGNLPSGVEVGISVHRKLDIYFDQQPEIQAFLKRFEKPMRRYAGIVADVVYDHILARQWSQYYEQSLPEFCQEFYRQLAVYNDRLPVRAQQFLDHAPKVGWLEGYSKFDNLPLILQRIGGRFRQPVALQNALPTVIQHQDAIDREFHELYPRLQRFVHTKLQQIELV
jgi:acyl carrier protein phosphodiesterase